MTITRAGSQLIATALTNEDLRFAIGVGTGEVFSLPPTFFAPTGTVSGGRVTFSKRIKFTQQTNVSLVALVDKGGDIVAAHSLTPTTILEGQEYNVSVRFDFSGE